jgi:hypothetical protein
LSKAVRFLLGAIILAIASWGNFAMPAACCLGGTPRNFISLQKLQRYELGVSTAYRNIYGQYDSYGALVPFDGSETLSLSLAGGTRLTNQLETYAVMPFIYQHDGVVTSTQTTTSLGDAIFGFRYVLAQTSFQDDWYPDLFLLTGLKIPTGAVETPVNSRLLPGTSNGLWEPYAGLLVQKQWGRLIFSASGSYTFRIGAGPADLVQDGDRIDCAETVTYVYSKQFSLGVGSSQGWTLFRSQRGRTLVDGAGRLTTVFLNPTYFLGAGWSIMAVLDQTIPISSFGVNETAATTLSLVAKYDVF